MILLLLAALDLVAARPPTASCDPGDLVSLAEALGNTVTALEARPSERMKLGTRSLSAGDYAARTLRPILKLAAADDRDGLCRALERLAWMKPRSTILMTAYNTPTVRGSLRADATYRHPIYRRPAGAGAKLSTAQILAGALRGHELVWLADPYDALALHVEGSAHVILPDGSQLELGTDGTNGQPYQNVSKLLAADGKLTPGVGAPDGRPGNPKARAYFAAHPDELDRYWGRNPHFVFFKRVPAAGAGKLGQLTPHRSVAIDPKEIPLGSLLWIGGRLVLGQDVGAGIQGARIDLYEGDDAAAQIASQTLTQNVDAYVLVAN